MTSGIATARRTDPVSSHVAAREVVESGRGAGQAAQVLALVRSYPGETAGELAVRSAVYDRPLDSVQVTRRLADLRRDGSVTQGEARKCRSHDRLMATWWPVQTQGSLL